MEAGTIQIALRTFTANDVKAKCLIMPYIYISRTRCGAAADTRSSWRDARFGVSFCHSLTLRHVYIGAAESDTQLRPTPSKYPSRVRPPQSQVHTAAFLTTARMHSC